METFDTPFGLGSILHMGYIKAVHVKLQRQLLYMVPDGPDGCSRQAMYSMNARCHNYSTVTDLARLRGLSTSVPRAQAV